MSRFPRNIALQIALILVSGLAWGAAPSSPPVTSPAVPPPTPPPSKVSAAVVPTPPELKSLLKPEVFARLNQEREIHAYAKIDDGRYHFYSAMSVRAGVDQARETLTDYGLYQKMVPFVSKSEAVGPLLKLEGGVFGWKLSSLVRITTIAPNWLKYRIVGGHLTGLSGQVVFQRKGERETLVYFDGELQGKNWPPAFVMERGAEIVFGLTAERMRSCIEKRDTHGESKSGAQAGQKDSHEKVGPEKDGNEKGSGEKDGQVKDAKSVGAGKSESDAQKGEDIPRPRAGLPKTD